MVLNKHTSAVSVLYFSFGPEFRCHNDMNGILKSILQAKIIFLKRKGSEHTEEGREMLKGKKNYGVKETMSAKARADKT